jgi:predicted NBD/HSP70 family sugar kinase
VRHLYPRASRATRNTSREINRQMLLDHLRRRSAASRADLARLMGMQRSAIGSLVNDLIAEGLVREGATGQAARGRKPTLLYLDSQGRCVVAVDIRATRTYLVLTDMTGHELSPVESFPTDRRPAVLVRTLAARVRETLAAWPQAGSCQGVGVAVPGMLDRSGDVVVHAPALGWRDVPLREPLRGALQLPVLMENAAKACALAMLWMSREAHPPHEQVYVSVSDGVGVGVVVAGEILRGQHNVAGEYGHVPLSLDGPPCACGSRGCWEAYVSNLATISRYVGRPFLPSRPIPGELASLNVLDVVSRARTGDTKAADALGLTGRYLGLGLAMIVNSLDPGRVCIGGEITAAWDLIEPAVRGGLAERVLFAAAADTEIRVVPTDEHPRLRGASALVGAPTYAGSTAPKDAPKGRHAQGA